MATLLTAGCGATKTPDLAAPTGDTLPDVVASGAVAVLADPVLSVAFNESKARLAIDNGGLRMAMTFGAIDQGAVGVTDVVAGPSTALEPLVRAGIVDAATPFARDDLEAAISPGNPKQLAGAADLARGGLRVLFVATDDAARATLARLGARGVPVADLAAGVGEVNAGRADALVAYASELAASAADLRVSIPPELNTPRVYAAAIVKGTKQRTVAAAFVEQLTSGVGSQAIQGSGFHLP